MENETKRPICRCVVMGGYMRDSIEQAIKDYLDFKLYGKVNDKSDLFISCPGTSQYSTRVIGPCVTRVYTGQKKDI